LARGDQIVAVGDDKIDSWQALRLALLDRALDGKAARLTVIDTQGHQQVMTLAMQQVPEDPDALFKRLGLTPYQPPATPVIARVMANTPAASAGLQSGDEVIAADGQDMDSPRTLVQWIQAHPDARAVLTIKRDGDTLTLPVRLTQT